MTTSVNQFKSVTKYLILLTAVCRKSINNRVDNNTGISKYKKNNKCVEIQLTFLQFLPRCYGWLYLAEYRNVANKTTNLTSTEIMSEKFVSVLIDLCFRANLFTDFKLNINLSHLKLLRLNRSIFDTWRSHLIIRSHASLQTGTGADGGANMQNVLTLPHLTLPGW